MKTSTRLSLGFAAVLALLLPVVGYLGLVVHGAVESSRALATSGTRTLSITLEQLEALTRYRENTQKWWITEDPRYAALADSAWRSFGRGMEELRALSRVGGEGAEIQELVARWAAAADRAGEGGSAVPWRVDPGDALLVLDARVGPLREQTLRVHQAGRAGMEAEVIRAEEVGERAERLAVGLGVAASLLGFLVAVLVIRSLSRAVSVLQDGTHAVARGDFEHRLDESRRDEFGRVARDFNRMTERLGELDRLKQDFVSHVSHELKTPLASMEEIHHVLVDGLAGPLTERQRRLLELNLRSGARLSRMITRLLDLSTIEAGSMEYELEEADLAAIVREVVEPFDAREPGSPARVDLRAEGPLPARVDVARFGQVVENLVENALKFSPAGSPVTVALTAAPTLPEGAPSPGRRRIPSRTGWAVLSVEDHGVGVPADQRERIFERFVRLPAAVGTRRPGGVGLGLALSRDIVQAHGGRIWVEDRPEGPGARFVVVVPLLSAVRAGVDPPAPLAQAVG